MRRAATSISLIVGGLALAVTALTTAPAVADTTIGGPMLAETGLVVDLPPGAQRPPGVDAAAYVLADLDTGQIIAAKSPHRRLRPASTQKMLTAVTLLPRLNKTDAYEARHSDAAQEGSSVGLVEGHRYTIHQLFLGMLLPSGNDAAHALAMAAGGVARTRALMMAEAHRLQALDTTVVNSSGLDEPGQYSSAYDLALFARAGMARADFRRYVSTQTADFPDDAMGKTYQIQNGNRLLGSFWGTIGVKTGYTSLAHHTYAVAVNRNGHTLLLTLMRSDGSLWEDAKALVDWGFANLGVATPVGQLVDPVPPGGVAAPNAPPSERPAAGPAAVSNGFPFAASAASVGGVALVSGLTAVGVRRRQRRRRIKAALAYRAAGFSTIAYVRPPGPLVAQVSSGPPDGYRAAEAGPRNGPPGPRIGPPGPRIAPPGPPGPRYGPPGPGSGPPGPGSGPPGPGSGPPGPRSGPPGPGSGLPGPGSGPPGPRYGPRGPGPSPPRSAGPNGRGRSGAGLEPAEHPDDFDPPGSYPDHGQQLDLSDRDRPPPRPPRPPAPPGPYGPLGPPGRYSARRRGPDQYR
ncbi:MAG TPA: D-alanyl-D-alanine carboxypeptidase [Actinomycetes bacterium]|nr:D-alanyl-D-alanine carboxypeptidase [Actinomycetes bacterium]